MPKMAFNPLTEAECGQKNPLARLASHVTHDHAFAEAHNIFPSTSDQLVEQYLHETKNVPQSFRLDDLMREMHAIDSQNSALLPIPHKDHWEQEYNSVEHRKPYSELVPLQTNQHNEDIWAEISSQERKFFEDNWQHTFDHAEASTSSPTASQLTAQKMNDTVDDPALISSNFMQFMRHVGAGDVTLENQHSLSNIWSDEFLSSQPEDKTSTDEGFNSQIWDNIQEDLKRATFEDDNSDQTWLDEYENYLNVHKHYTFAEDNPMFDLADALQRGKEYLAEGDLPSAVLCFEAAVKQQESNSEAWLLLGKTQAENEQDTHAIPALKKCVELDPHNLEALMALSVCYTNESYYSLAGQMLFKWIQTNPKYADLAPSNYQLNGDQQKFIQDLYIKAALRQPENIDYEVQSGLGVLFNLSGEYDKAADCFRAALSVKPDDAKLWNRLGATLANGSKSEEAVEAYHHALNLEPGFIRARYNVGIICINLRAYKEAAEHLLTALNQQARGRNVEVAGAVGGKSQMSDSIWSTLRMCIALSDMPHLKELVDKRDLNGLNRELELTEHN